LSEDYKKQREEVKALAKRKVRLVTTSNLNKLSLYSKKFLEIIEIKIRVLWIIYFLSL
jgi:hypothetical protein